MPVASAFGACPDIATETKHFVLKKDYQDRVTEKTSAISGYGVGRYGKGAFGVGEPSIVIVLWTGDGSMLSSLLRQ